MKHRVKVFKALGWGLLLRAQICCEGPMWAYSGLWKVTLRVCS